MNSSKLFSVAVITYNQEDLVKDCLESIKKQNYQALEIILYDDFSQDSTFQILNDWKEENLTLDIKIFRNKKNMGISATHNAAARLAKGYYFKYIGGDDILGEDAIEKVVRYFNTDSNINCIMSRVVTFSNIGEIKNGNNSVLPPHNELSFFEKKADVQYLDLVYKNDIIAPGMFFKMKALQAVDYFDPCFKKFEDYHTWMKLTKVGYKIYHLPEVLVFWRRHNESVSFSAWDRGDRDYKSEELRVITKYMQPYLKTLPLSHRLHIFYKKIYLKSLIRFGVNRRNHKIFRIVYLFSPLWIKKLPQYIRKKFF